MLSAPPCQVSSGPGLYVTSDNDSSGTSHHSQAPTHTLPPPAELPRRDPNSLLSSPGPPPSPASPPGFLARSFPCFWRGLRNSSLSLGSYTEKLTASKWYVPPASKGASLLPAAGPPQGPPSTQFFPLRRRGPPSPSFPRCPGRFPSLHLVWLIPPCGPHMMEAPSPGFRRRHSGILYGSCCLLGTRCSLLRHASQWGSPTCTWVSGWTRGCGTRGRKKLWPPLPLAA